jgi:hypothetical protein
VRVSARCRCSARSEQITSTSIRTAPAFVAVSSQASRVTATGLTHSTMMSSRAAAAQGRVRTRWRSPLVRAGGRAATRQRLRARCGQRVRTASPCGSPVLSQSSISQSREVRQLPQELIPRGDTRILCGRGPTRRARRAGAARS